jgi:NAD(P)-dependent dehydrogenase (short-subunit alcohol dehydrogenase family)
MTAQAGSSSNSPSTDPVAVVTGANRGIGLEVCRQLAELGYITVLGARDLAKGRRAAAEVNSSGRVVAVALDVSDDASVRAAAQWVNDQFHRCDALINNAAIHYDTWQRAVSADLSVVREAIETNLFGAWRASLAFLPMLRGAESGRIVNVSSEGGSLADMGGGTPAYSVSKAALNALTRTLAGELRHTGILVNAVCPGWTATDMGGGGGRAVRDGAASVVWAVTLPDGGPTGGFFRDGRPVPW